MNKGAIKQTLEVLCLALFLAACSHTEELKFVAVSGEEIVSFQVEIADDQAEWQRGLQGRLLLNDKEGTLFVFPDEAVRSFWMKDTLIPLDIIFADSEGKILNVQSNALPCQHDPCENYYSNGKAQYVLEINAGLAEKYKVKEGASLLIPEESLAR